MKLLFVELHVQFHYWEWIWNTMKCNSSQQREKKKDSSQTETSCPNLLVLKSKSRQLAKCENRTECLIIAAAEPRLIVSFGVLGKFKEACTSIIFFTRVLNSRVSDMQCCIISGFWEVTPFVLTTFQFPHPVQNHDMPPVLTYLLPPTGITTNNGRTPV